MNAFRHVFLLGVVITTFSFAANPAPKESGVRGIGKIAVESRLFNEGAHHSSWITFTAEDAEHAAICAAKFLADYTQWGPIKIAHDTKLPGTVLHLEGSGWWVLGLDDKRFQILFAPTPEEAQALAKKASADKWKPVPENAYPHWLDCFDNSAFGIWVHGGGVLSNDLPKDLAFLADHRLTACFAETTETRLVAPGVLDTATMDWEDAISKKYNLRYRTLMSWGSVLRPQWPWNRTPLPHVVPLDDYHPYGDFSHQQFACYNVFEPIPATNPIQFDMRRRIASEQGKYDNFIGHHGSAELASAGLSELTTAGGTPGTKDLWHNYLKNVLGWSLADVGQHHEGNPAAYKTWDDVNIPLPQTIYGMDADSINLRGMWEGRPDDDGVGTDAKWFDDQGTADWKPIDCNDPMILIYVDKKKQDDKKLDTSYWLRRKFTVTAAQLENAKFLHLSPARWHASSSTLPAVYLNGQELKCLTDMSPVRNSEDLCFDVSSALRAGENQIVLNPHGEALASYIFLSKAGTWEYPGPNPNLNRQYFDAVNFEVWLRVHQLGDTLRAMRSDEPYRPIKLMAPGGYLDAILPLCDQYGAYVHDTGQTGACWAPWPTRYALTRNQPISSEPGGPADNAETFQQFVTFYLMLGDSAVDIVFHPDIYRKSPEISAWIDQNIELIRCIGKMNMVLPQIGILRSVRDAGRLKFNPPWAWDIGRGELQQVGRTCYYSDLPDVLDGRIDQFKVLFDDGTTLLTEDELKGLERYVQQGGTFVVLQNTGMHTPEQAYSWPISRLTGLKVINRGEMSGQLVFREDEDLWPNLRGREMKGWGMVLDWQKVDQTGPSLGLNAADKDVHVVAEWKGIPEGEGKIAVAYRNLGKGKVVTIGSNFWRQAHDESGRYQSDAGTGAYLDELLTSLGIPRDSWRTGGDSTHFVFAEHWLSKNGVFDLYPVAYVREHQKDPYNFDVSFRRATPVSSVLELSASGFPSHPATWADGVLHIAGVQIDPMQTRVYAAPRADIAQAPLYWLETQTHQWPILPVIPDADKPPLQNQVSDILPLQDGWSIEGGDAWPDTPPPDILSASYKTVKLGSFAVLGLPEDAVAHFRRTIKLPATWYGQRIRLHFDAEHWFWGIRPKGRLWVNGQPAPLSVTGDQETAFSFDVTPPAGQNTLELALEVDGRVKEERDRRGRPSGVTGAFYLQATPQPISSQPLTDWQAATDLNVFQAVAPDQPTTYSYLETHFTLPQKWPAPRLVLESEKLGWIVLNGTIIQIPSGMASLDISHLVHRDGTNVLRWLPRQDQRQVPPPSPLRTYTGKVPDLKLSWLPPL